MIRFRRLSPAGAPIGVRDLRAWRRALAAADGPVAGLEAALRDRAGVPHCRVTCTGRAGLTLLLAALRDLAPPHRTQVIVPSYTCFSVPASVVKAGLSPRVADIVPATLDYDCKRLEGADFGRVLAIVATNLFGFPNDMPRLEALARDRGVFLVDDAAQALGARVGGRPCGTFGDAGLYSFDKGKNIAACGGGAIVTRSDAIARAVDARLAPLPRPPAGREAADLAKTAAYVAFLRPSLYWIPASVPGLGLGTTRYTTDFALERPNPRLAALAHAMLAHLEDYTRQRCDNGRRLLDGLSGLRDVEAITPHADAHPACLRLPVLVAHEEARRRVIDAVGRHGGGATGSYPTSIADIPDLRQSLVGADDEAAGGRAVASRIVTLPTHPFVTQQDVERLVAIVAAALASPGSRATVRGRLRWSAR